MLNTSMKSGLSILLETNLAGDALSGSHGSNQNEQATRVGGIDGSLNNARPPQINVYLHRPMRSELLPKIQKYGLRPGEVGATLSKIDTIKGGFGLATDYNSEAIFFGGPNFFKTNTHYNAPIDEFVFVLCKDFTPMIDPDYARPNRFGNSSEAFTYIGQAFPLTHNEIETVEVVSFTLPLGNEQLIGLSRFIFKDSDHAKAAFAFVRDEFNRTFCDLHFLHRETFHFPNLQTVTTIFERTRIGEVVRMVSNREENGCTNGRKLCGEEINYVSDDEDPAMDVDGSEYGDVFIMD